MRRNPGALTDRQVEVLQLVVSGASVQQVAEILCVSPKTVKNHLADVYSQLEVPNLTQAVLLALRIGAVQL